MPINADTVSAIRALADRAEHADGVAPFSEATRLALPDATPDHAPAGTPIAHLTFDPTEQLLAAGIVLPDGSAELVVDPEHRRKGLGTELLSRILSQHPDAHVWAHGDLPGAHPLATAAGLRRIRTLLKLARPVDGDPEITDPAVPQGFSLTTFDTDRDAEDWLALNKTAFDYHPEQGRMTMADLQQRIAEPWFDPHGLLLLRDGEGRLAASHWTKIEPAEPAEGEVYVVAVDPAYQGHGLGKFITAAGLAHLRDKGVDRISLYVEGDNDAALATYRGLGFTPAAVDEQYAR
ncbi:mycothiol synthase [Branchiibius sp. NY16-3462-2]|uniref:mycothiol synthase n=1 Tax=Branchiibius sp. NY16-3462-2 TaxID=1807500 RepID=UPI0025BAD4BE|nr:mycothiol synthase [Branchiibius sp. NY16-3462-2]